MSITDKINYYKELFKDLSPSDRSVKIMQYAKSMTPCTISPENRHRYRIPQCHYKSYMDCIQIDGLIYYTGDSEALSIRGYLCIIFDILDGHTANEIRDSFLDSYDLIGIKGTRNNGLNKILEYAKNLVAKYTL